MGNVCYLLCREGEYSLDSSLQASGLLPLLGSWTLQNACTYVYFRFLAMSGVKLDPASGVPDLSTVHEPVGDLFQHVTLVCQFENV